MSFGFAVGDFIAAGKLIKDIITILRTSARSEYQELMLELHGLQRALDKIEHLEAPLERQLYVVSIRVAALMCSHVLDEFAGKLKKFESLAGQPGNSKVRIWTQKLRWGFTMDDEVRNLRAYIIAHVGSLNMRLLTEALSSTYVTGERVERTQTSLVGVRESTKATSKITQSIQSTLEKIATVITSEVIPQLKTLVEQVARIWQSNARVVSFLAKMQESPTPALRYTWFQAPVKFEDALGRVFPIPSEFDWLKVEGIILAHFSTGPGHTKVAAGEYELFDPLDNSGVISKSSFNGLRPGMSLTMAFIIGRYSHAFSGNERCPRPGCQSSAFTLSDGRKQCTKCNIYFEDARTQLPLPYRDDTLNRSFEDHDNSIRTLSPQKRKRIDTWDNQSVGVHLYKVARKERLCFKNIRLTHLPLPQTPPVRNVRRTPKQKHRDPLETIKKTRLKRGYRSLATIAKENHPKAYVENAIDSQRDHHDVEQKVGLIHGVFTHPNTKTNLNGVNYPGVTYKSGFILPNIDPSESSMFIESNRAGPVPQWLPPSPHSSNRSGATPLAFLGGTRSSVFSQQAPTVFSEAGICNDDSGSVISAATMPAIKLQIASHKPRLHKAEKLQVQVNSRVLGEEHPDTLTSMVILALAYWNQGRWKEAEELNVQVMETRKRVLGEEHLDTLTSMANLASTFWNQGRWKEAEELNVQVMETRKRVLGEEHLDTLTSMANLASTFWNQGRWKEAEELNVQVIETRKRVLGAEHPDTLTSMTNLASTFWNQGRWKEAEELNVQVIETRKRILGAEHPDTLTNMANLAATFWNQGRWKEAEELNVQVIETRKRVLGAEHPDTLTSIANLASTFWNQGQWKEAEELNVQVIETRKRVLGAEHPDTLTSMANLASTYRNQGRWKKAEELEVQVIETSSRVLGVEHPSTLTSMNNLAHTWKSQGRSNEAISLLAECHKLRKRILGPRHPFTLSSLNALNKWRIERTILES